MVSWSGPGMAGHGATGWCSSAQARSAGTRSRLRVLRRVNAGGVQFTLRTRVDLGDYAADAVWSPDGRHLVVAGGQGALLWIDATAPDATAQRLGEHAGGALALAWQGGGRLFASSGQDGEVRLWDARQREARVIHAAAEWSECLAFASHGRLLAVGTGRSLQVFDSTGQRLSQPPPPAGGNPAPGGGAESMGRCRRRAGGRPPFFPRRGAH